MPELVRKEDAPSIVSPGALRLNLGCGEHTLDDWQNIDIMPGPGVDVVADLEEVGECPLPFADSSVADFRLLHVIEHIRNVLPLMEELWRIAAAGAVMLVRCPYGSSDNADEDPTHVRRMFLESFGYFSQPYYHRARPDYLGDWQVGTMKLLVDKAAHEGTPFDTLRKRIMHERNIVMEMVVHLRAVKPARPRHFDLIVNPDISIVLVDKWLTPRRAV